MTVIYSRAGNTAIDRFELYTAALSSLTRRRAGDYTIMHCDTRSAEYFVRIGLADLWDEMRVTIPDDLGGINRRMFWAAGKLFALKSMPCPVLMLDTDFIAWQLPELGEGIVAAHREELKEEIYPPVTHFRMKPGYRFIGSSARPLNTAFLYMNDYEFKQYYTDRSIEFMKSARDCDDYLTYMVYAEQRLLAVLAEQQNIKTGTLFELHEAHIQRRYTHVWGAKQVMRDIPPECEAFCEKCRARIRRDFPKHTHIIEMIESTQA
jgi:hypothetical protein